MTSASGIAASPHEFADELSRLLADAVWAVVHDEDARPAMDLVAAIDRWREHPLVSRAAALAADTATFGHAELEPLRRALVRAAGIEWTRDPYRAQRVPVLRRWAAIEHEEECSLIAADLLATAVALCEEQVATDRAQWLPQLADLLRQLLDVLSETGTDGPAEHAEVMAQGIGVGRQLIDICIELVETDRSRYLCSLAEAQMAAADFVAWADGPAAGAEVSERGVRRYEELPGVVGLTALRRLDLAWSEHIGRLKDMGAVTQVADWERHRTERLREFAVAAVDSARSGELRRLARLLRRHALHAEAVTVSARVVSLAEQATADGEKSALTQLAEMLRRHGVDLHRAGMYTEAATIWQQSIEAAQRLRDTAVGNTTAVAEGYRALVKVAGELADSSAAVEFGDAAVTEWMRLSELDSRAHLAALVDELRAQTNRLRAAGRSAEAADVAERAVAHAGDLVSIDPDQYRPNLSWTLTCATRNHLVAWRIEDADRRSREAVELIEQLAAADPGGYAAPLANALNNRAVALNHRKDYRQSREFSARSVVMYEGLVANHAHHTGHRASLANALSTRCHTLRRLREFEAALGCAVRAEAIYSQLAERNPRKFLPDLAYALNTMASVHEDMGHSDAVWEVATKALEICDRLAEGRVRDEYLASALHALVRDLIDAGRGHEALTYSTRLLELRERMAARDPAAETLDLAIALGNHATCLRKTGRRQQMLECTQRALDLLRQLSESDPHQFRDRLASALDGHAIALVGARRHQQAVEASAEAVDRYEQLLVEDRDLYLGSAVRCLQNHAGWLDKVGRTAEAVRIGTRVLGMCEELVALDSRAHRATLGGALLDHTRRLVDLGRGAEALGYAERAVPLFEELSPESPGAHALSLARALDNRAAALCDLERYDEAVAVQEQAVRICEVRVSVDRSGALEVLARTTYNLACRLANARQWARARDCSRTATLLWQEVVDTDLELHQPVWAEVLADCARISGDGGGEWAEAAAYAERAATEYEELSTRDPQRYRLDWAGTVQYHAIARRRAGELPRASAEAERALSLWRTAAAEHPGQALSELASGEAWVARFRLYTEEPELAPGHLDQAVRHYRALIDGGRADMAPKLVAVHKRYATSLRETGHRGRAPEAIAEAVRLARDLVATDPAAHCSVLIDVLQTQAWLCTEAGLRHTAVDAGREALALLAETLPDRTDDYRRDLANGRDDLADSLADMGQLGEALALNARALPLWEELAGERDAPYAELAWSLWRRARWLSASGEDDATVLSLSQRAVAIYEQTCENRPGNEFLAGVLVDHARHLARAGRHADAMAKSTRALRLWETLAAGKPQLHRPGLADCLRWRSAHSAQTGRHDDAVEYARRALQLTEEAVEQAPPRYLPELAALCREFALLLCDGNPGEARAMVERSVTIYTELADEEPDVFGERLSDARGTADLLCFADAPE